jgi:hypothetical protein
MIIPPRAEHKSRPVRNPKFEIQNEKATVVTGPQVLLYSPEIGQAREF